DSRNTFALAQLLCKRQHSGTESCAPAKRYATWKAEHSGTENALMLKQRPYGGTELVSLWFIHH
ncbi:MAG: hypothetical protein AAGJ08_00595, partial [Cyanobacteria bacterium P01_H01_bin.35]